MSQQDSKSSSEKASERFGIGWILLFITIGVLIIVFARISGKDFATGDIVYDIGIAIVTLALADLIILSSLRKLASIPTEHDKHIAAALAEQEKRLAFIESTINATNNLINQSRTSIAETQQDIAYIRLEYIESTVELLSEKLDGLNEKIEKIRAQVDPVYGELLRDNEKRMEEENEGKDEEDEDDDED